MPQSLDSFYPYETWNSVLRLFCLSCVHRDGLKVKASWSMSKNLFYILTLGLINVINMYLKMQSFVNMQTLSFSDIFQMYFLLFYLEYMLVLYLVYKYGSDAFLQYFIVYDNFDRCFKMTPYKDMKNCIFYIMVAFLSINTMSTIFHYITWVFAVSWQQTTLYAIEYIYFHLRILSIIDIMINLVQVEYRMRVMADILKDFYESGASLPEVKETKIMPIAPRNENNQNRLNLLKTICINREHEILQLKRCYLLLLEQTDFINNMYGFRILMACCSFLVDTSLNINLIIRVTLGRLGIEVNISLWYITLFTILRFVTSCLFIFGQVYRAEQINKMSRKIIRLVDLTLMNKAISYEIRDTLNDLRGLVMSRPVEFHGIHFFKLNYRLLMSITSVVVTYTILLLQYIK